MSLPVVSDEVLRHRMVQRQWLDRRHPGTVVEAVRHLVGLQAQAANAPYLGLWTRLEDFAQNDLTRALESRLVVRGGLLRGTQHIVAAADYPWLRGLVKPIGVRTQRASFGRRTSGVDLTELAAVARDSLRGRQLTRPQLRDILAAHFPGSDADALAWSVPSLIPIVHPPPSGTWRRGGATPFALATDWLDQPAVDPAPDPEALIVRYLTAFGPASVRDVQAWSGLRGLSEVTDRMSLTRWRDVRGHELLDLPDVALAQPAAEMSVRFLPEFDNLLVAYADRSRLMTDEVRHRVCLGSMVFPSLLISGQVMGTWQLVRNTGMTVLEVTPFSALPEATQTLVYVEGQRLLAFAADSDRPMKVRLRPGKETS